MKRFWVIDDDHQDREKLKRSLERSMPEIFVETFAEMPKQVNCDAIFLERDMGTTDGYKVAKELRARGVRIPIVIVTSDDIAKLDWESCDVDGIACKDMEASFIGCARGMIKLIEAHGHDYCQR